MESIRTLLEQTEALEPQTTDMQSVVYQMQDIEAFVFDIYGTLLISASGDIEESEWSEEVLRKALIEGGIEIVNNDQFQALRYGRHILEKFQDTIKNHHEQLSSYAHIDYPEVDIVEIWKLVLAQAAQEGWIKFSPHSDVKRFVFSFELFSNKVYPMPGMQKLIQDLIVQNQILGIVSNAQFYTPIIMNYFLNNSLAESIAIPPFESELTYLSYREGVAKPDNTMFEKLAQQLEQTYRIPREKALYIGNDMYKDVYPAQNVGFKTALFAGDRRSLRLRNDKPEIAELEPDICITELMQLLNIF